MVSVREYTGDWEQMEKVLENKDVLKLCSFFDLAQTQEELKQRLTYCKQKDITLQIRDSYVTADVYMEVVHYMKHMDMQKKQKSYEARKKGIQKALQRKEKGEGQYGRPKIVLPKNFEEQIMKCMDEKKTLESYRKKTKMKKSTFYKYVRSIREKMKNDV